MKNIFFAIALASATFAAQAGTISDLYNTGTGLSAGTQDQNYTVTGDGANGNSYATQNDLYPIGPWIDNTATSGWLSPSNNQGSSFPYSNYDWKTTFDLTGFDTASASFSGKFASDDEATVYLNGTQIGTSSGYWSSFASWSSFTSQPGLFVAGLNTLEFQVNNSGGGPTGLRTEFTASSETAVSAVPEPETYAMLLAGLGLMGFMSRRRKNS